MNLQEVLDHNRRVPVPGYASHNLRGEKSANSGSYQEGYAHSPVGSNPAHPFLSTDDEKFTYPPVSSHEPSEVMKSFFIAELIPLPVMEYQFHPKRKWRFDLAWPEQKLALEVQGGIFSQGRHTRGAALLKEWEKLNTAATLGWRILYCQPKDLLARDTATMIFSALNP